MYAKRTGVEIERGGEEATRNNSCGQFIVSRGGFSGLLRTQENPFAIQAIGGFEAREKGCLVSIELSQALLHKNALLHLLAQIFFILQLYELLQSLKKIFFEHGSPLLQTTRLALCVS